MLEANVTDHADYAPHQYGTTLFERAFSRITSSHPVGGNSVRLLRDATENYPAWIDAIAHAEHTIHFENYIFADDETGREIAAALAARARAGIKVRFVYDWLGSFGAASSRFWDSLRHAGVDVRAFNPPRLSSPFGWISRDHRKTLTVDGRIGFVSGLCVARDWAGDSARGIPPWRDTGVEIRGPAVADLDRAFAEVWSIAGGEPLPETWGGAAQVGTSEISVIRGRPGQLSAYRLDQLVAAGARKTLWLTDAYFVATTPYVQALAEARRDGVDVRILLPGSSDVPAAQTLARSGYRPLLETGIRIFEWKGPMLHAKTAVCDGRWARVGSTNLNLVSWLSNWELDVTIEDPHFAAEMEAAYLDDLENATEIVLDEQRHLLGGRPRPRTPGRSRKGSAGRIAAGALSLGSAAGAALTGSRSLGVTEGKAVLRIGLAAIAAAVLIALFPVLIAAPLVMFLGWSGFGLLSRAWRLRKAAATTPGACVEPPQQD